jgi:hypothetical protein
MTLAARPASFNEPLILFVKNDFPIPDPSRLTTIVNAALAAQYFFFVAANEVP